VNVGIAGPLAKFLMARITVPKFARLCGISFATGNSLISCGFSSEIRRSTLAKQKPPGFPGGFLVDLLTGRR
jgi:hypothetical protein